ncbi:MAG: endonuclease III [Spirochaetota bacterium]
MKQELSSTILNILRETYGHVEPGLHYKNLYQLLISVVLSAQTTDKQVNTVTPVLFQEYPDFQSLAHAEIADIEIIIKSTGFYRNKAKNIVMLSRMILSKYNGIVPDALEDLTFLPGVGRKSAQVVRAFGFGIPAIPVDTHVMRVSKRIGYTTSTNPVEVERALALMIAEEYWIESHVLFITHGRHICVSRKPLCDSCPIYRYCDFVNNNP